MRAALQDFIDAPVHQRRDVSLGRRFTLSIFPASSPHATFFVMGGHTDRQAGGWVVCEVERNLRICIEQKTNKLKGYRSKYPEWWLVLVDHIAYGLDAESRQQLKSADIKHDWDKVIVVSSMNHKSWFEL